MKDKIFPDTEILVYILDNENITIKEKAKSILESFYNDNNYCISTQVVQEFCNVVLKKIEPEVPEEQLAEFISTFPSEQIRAIDVSTVIAALSVKEKFRYSFRDSLIIA